MSTDTRQIIHRRSWLTRWFEAPRIGRMAPATSVVVYGLLLLWTAFVLFPLYWLLITSVKQPIDVNGGPFYLPWIDFTPSLHAWRELFIIDYEDTLKAYINSIIIALLSTALCVLVGAMAAYALARIQYRPKFGTIALFVICMIVASVAVGRWGIDWRISIPAGLAVFYLLARALGRYFKRCVGNGGDRRDDHPGGADGDRITTFHLERYTAGGGERMTQTQKTAQPLSIRNVNKSFGAVHVVKDLSLDVAAGEFLVLLGPSGCGKTTALRMIAGLESVDSGSIVLGDNDMTHVLPKYRDIAMVFQSYALYPHKTVAENIGFPLKVRGVPPDARLEAVREAAAQVHMETLLDRYPRELSGGQRQRVALARAMIRRPAAFLMDEPLSNLDAKLRGYMRAELKHMQYELGTTTIYVTHDQIEAMTLAHRVAIMNEGVLQQLGTPREVYDQPANLFVAGFMGSPPMNFIHGGIEGSRFQSAGVDIPVDGAAGNGAAVLGFRPEDAQIVDAGRGLFDASVFAAELTGEYTLVTVMLGEASLAVKMPRDYDIGYDSTVAVSFAPDRGFLFDATSGARLAAQLSEAG